MRSVHSSFVVSFLVSISRVGAAFAQEATPPPEPTQAPATDPRVDALEKRLAELEKKSAVEQVPANPQADATQKKGILAFSNDTVSVRFRPLLQTDGRFFVANGTNQFLARRIRPAFEATFFDRIDLRITPEFAGTPTAVDAYANLKLIPELQLRAGKFKSPFSLERLAQDSDLVFAERSLASTLAPDRDVGVQLHGELLKGTIAYAGGVFDGALDNQQLDGDTDDRKDIAGRIFVRPFAATDVKPLQFLGFGIAGTSGQHDGTLTTWKSTGQATIFGFVADAAASGSERRLAPQAYYYFGPFGIFGEYVRISENVRRAAGPAGRVEAQAFDVTVSFLVTGEKATYTTIAPIRVFDPGKGTWGAIELKARVSQLKVSSTPFDRGLADDAKSIRKATELAVGVSWHLAPAIKFVADYYVTRFEGGGGKGAGRDTEKVLIGRFQIAY
jgi:phosphate-selective porin OprO/OprP